MISQSPPARRLLSESQRTFARAACEFEEFSEVFYLLVGGLIPPSPGRFELVFDDGVPVVGGAAPPVAGAELL
jgi:hypothetical protein